MKVKCIINKKTSIVPLVLPLDINEEISDENFIVTDLEASGSIIGYDLSVGRDYVVYGILEYDGEKRFLVQDDSNIPSFHSSKLFQIINSNYDFEWETKIFLINDKQLLITSYNNILNYNNLIELIEKKPKAIRIFWIIKNLGMIR